MEQKPERSLKILSEQQVKELTMQGPGMGTVYANHARIAPSFYDVRLFLGQSSVTPLGVHTVQEQLCVIFSPECAKMIALGMVNSLEQFEKFFGPLRALPKASEPVPPTAQKKKKK